MVDILTKLSSKYGCDKSDKNHKYTNLYHQRFEKDRNRKFKFVEFGFGVGNSVKMWMDYFLKAKMFTIDIREPPKNDPLITNYIQSGRLKYILANQIEREGLEEDFKKEGGFYIIIDDASHRAEDQQFTFGFSFKYVLPGGWYIIEDLKCKRSPNPLFTEAEKTIEVLKKFKKTGILTSTVLSEKECQNISKEIESVDIYEKIAFIKKKG